MNNKLFAFIPTVYAADLSFSDNVSDWNKQLGFTDDKFNTPGGILNAVVPYLLVIGGLILLVMLVSGGFKIMTAVQDPKGAEAGKQQITNAIIGFFLLFAAFWIIQIIQVIFGIKITGSGS